MSFYGYDGHGSVRLLTDSAGSVTDGYGYDAFGILTGQLGMTGNVYLYAGEQIDQSLGMYFLRARYLRPFVARFITRDPFEGLLSRPSTLQSYVYGESNPANRKDPTGKLFSLIELAIGSGIRNPLQKAYLVMTVNHFKDTIPIICSLEPAARIRDAAINSIASGNDDDRIFELERQAREMISRGATLAALNIARGYYELGRSLTKVSFYKGKVRIDFAKVLGLVDQKTEILVENIKKETESYLVQSKSTFNSGNANRCRRFSEFANLVEEAFEITQETLISNSLEDAGDYLNFPYP